MRSLFFCLLAANLALGGWYMVFDNRQNPDQPPQPAPGSLELLSGAMPPGMTIAGHYHRGH